jgi:hypothetical protein
MNATTRLVLAAALALLCAPAQSQTMYRCGKVYQDRPCDAGTKGKAMGSTGVEAATPSGGGDAECAQRGKDSLKIVWSREGGATEERLLSETRSGSQQQFIRDVYRRRGSAAQVQAAVEADCVAEKERMRAAMAAAALSGQPLPASPAVREPMQPAADPEAEARRKWEREQKQAAAAAESRKRTCDGYNRQMESLRARERSGGSAATMDSLNAQRRDLRERMGKAGC